MKNDNESKASPFRIEASSHARKVVKHTTIHMLIRETYATAFFGCLVPLITSDPAFADPGASFTDALLSALRAFFWAWQHSASFNAYDWFSM